MGWQLSSKVGNFLSSCFMFHALCAYRRPSRRVVCVEGNDLNDRLAGTRHTPAYLTSCKPSKVEKQYRKGAKFSKSVPRLLIATTCTPSRYSLRRVWPTCNAPLFIVYRFRSILGLPMLDIEPPVILTSAQQRSSVRPAVRPLNLR